MGVGKWKRLWDNLQLGNSRVIEIGIGKSRKSVASKYSFHIFRKNILKPIESFDASKCKIGCKIVLLLLNVIGESFVKVIRSLLMKVGPQICNLIAKLGSS